MRYDIYHRYGKTWLMFLLFLCVFCIGSRMFCDGVRFRGRSDDAHS